MLLDRRTYVVKERVAFAKLTDTYDLLDAATGQPIGIAKEEPEAWAKWLRLIVNKKLMPTTVNVYEGQNEASAVVSIRRGVAIFRPKVAVFLRGREIGSFQAKAFSLGGAFRMFDAQGQEIGIVQGDWKGWNFAMTTAAGQELGRVTKKWAGIGKELFTSADTYVIDLTDADVAYQETAAMLLAAGLAIDTVFKESK